MNSRAKNLSVAIDSLKGDLANQIVNEQWYRNPGFQGRYGEAGHAKCTRDVAYNLSYLSQAISSSSPQLFESYVDWVKILFDGLKIPTRELTESLEITSDILQRRFPEDAHLCKDTVDAGVRKLKQAVEMPPSFIDGVHPQAELARNYLAALQNGDRNGASRLILDAVDSGVSIRDIYLHVFQITQKEIGRLWQTNQMSVALEHYCTAATQVIMSQLYPQIFNTEKRGLSMVAACVGGELHEIGLRMVADFFEMDGWDSYYLGSNTPAKDIVQTIISRKADVLAISATMTFHIGLVEELIEQVRSVEACKDTKILVGGYPFNIDANLWRQCGADGSATDAEQAIEIANILVAPQS